ncbi:hypothetical protein CF319_g9244 [Tilletia indica]|nr:hypothetical protein CF319_g9244 [Tilletia indica]
MRDDGDEQPGRTDAAITPAITTASSNGSPPPSQPPSTDYDHGVLPIMDQFNSWQPTPALTYDPNGFIANLDPAYISVAEQVPANNDPAYISVAEQVPANNTYPTQEPTYSQRCLQLLPEDIREAYKIAYEAVKRSIAQHERPDWDMIWVSQDR